MADREVADLNKGNIFQERIGGSLGLLPPRSIGGYTTPAKSVALTSPYQTPLSSFNRSARISRYFTVGEFTGSVASDPIPVPVFESVMNNHKNLAYNVLDRLREFWDIEILSAYRTDSVNHSTGSAVDVIVPNRSSATHVQIAGYARDLLPVDQVYIERNASGKTHVHLRAVQPGNVGDPEVFTFTDAEGKQKIDGLQIDLLIKDLIR